MPTRWLHFTEQGLEGFLYFNIYQNKQKQKCMESCKDDFFFEHIKDLCVFVLSIKVESHKDDITTESDNKVVISLLYIRP
jgi:hypothetical protein